MKMQNRWIVFGICSSLFLMSNYYRASNAIIATDITRDLSLTPENLGLLGAMFFYVFALVQFPMGLVLDHIGSRKTMIGLNLVAIGGALMFSFASELWSGLAGRALMGLGMSTNLMGGLKLYTRYFKPHEFATVSGLMFSVGILGNLLAATPLVLLVKAVGWRGSFWVLGGFNLLLVMLLALLVREDAREENKTAAPASSSLPSLEIIWRLVKEPSFWTIGMAAGLRFGAFASIHTLWAGPFLMVYLGLPGFAAGNILLFTGLGVIIGSPVGGLVSDRLLKSRKKTVMLSLVFLAASIFALSRWPGPVHLELLAALFFSIGFWGAFGQLLYAHIKDLMPQEMAGTAMSGVNFFVMGGAGIFLQGLGGILGSGKTGSLQAGGDYRTAFMVCGAAVVLAILFYAFSRDKNPDDTQSDDSGRTTPSAL